MLARKGAETKMPGACQPCQSKKPRGQSTFSVSIPSCSFRLVFNLVAEAGASFVSMKKP